MKRFINGVFTIAVLVGVLVLYNILSPVAQVPSLDERWWGGYYVLPVVGKHWCAARFEKQGLRTYKMVLVSSVGAPINFMVEQTERDEHFLRVVATNPEGMRIEAKQLYLGKRYIVQRLMVGRWRDSLNRNDDIAIRGVVSSIVGATEFAIEPLDDARFGQFWREVLARPDSPEALLGHRPAI